MLVDIEKSKDDIANFVDVLGRWMPATSMPCSNTGLTARRTVDVLVTAMPQDWTPFRNLNDVGRFLDHAANVDDDACKALRWITEIGHGWNQFFLHDLARDLGNRLARDRAHLLKPALDGLSAAAIERAVGDMAHIPPEARPELPPPVE
ncbi:MAG: hypothetical protein R2695_19470 [Acidimicrobiales bacterium]